ncbi:Uncharacterised protein [Enterobacter hormaechei]|nr:Uncharacterised protein [Enterobacter hormaechei]CZW73798.1 Uncharacterised protein [Enterobacter hormaechei]CZX31920.1 Uncharacterised protein [Enterobacter hormaechei]CZZ11458.1 Uncharacterised protein [Enterobacter hormaechei]SAA75393.1 Uncharacterised protein [Enterobacter hormaechei]
MRKFTFRQLAVSGLVCLSLSCIQPAAAASSVQVGFSPEGSALQLVLKRGNRRIRKKSYAKLTVFS